MPRVKPTKGTQSPGQRSRGAGHFALPRSGVRLRARSLCDPALGPSAKAAATPPSRAVQVARIRSCARRAPGQRLFGAHGKSVPAAAWSLRGRRRTRL